MEVSEIMEIFEICKRADELFEIVYEKEMMDTYIEIMGNYSKKDLPEEWIKFMKKNSSLYINYCEKFLSEYFDSQEQNEEDDDIVDNNEYSFDIYEK